MTLKTEFSTFLKRYGISQNKAADSLGYSGGAISSWLNDAYKGDVFAVEAAVRGWLDREGRRRAALAIDILETESFRRGTALVRMAHDNKVIGLLVGEAGRGKSTILKTYHANNPLTSIYLSVDDSMNKVVIIQKLAESLGFQAVGSVPDLAVKVHQALAERDMVVMIDEAEYLKENALELLRQLVNDKGRSGLVLAGLPRLEYRILNLKNNHQQISSRVGVFAEIGGMKSTDVEAIVTKAWPGIEADKEALRAFAKASGASGRRLAMLVQASHQTCLANGLERPTPEIVAAAGDLILDETRATKRSA